MERGSRNPYTLIFGKEPKQLISRSSGINDIIYQFDEEEPSQQIYMITGVRGCGKTVFMTSLAQQMRQRKDWIVLELNPEQDLLEGLAAKLSGENMLAKLFKAAKINLSVLGFGVEIEGVAPVRDVESAVGKMLEAIKKQKKRVLVTIDEATNSKSMRLFASAFQIYIRQELPIFLVMTGLYENINALQNEKQLTFLYRAPKMELKPLNIKTIADNYKNNFGLDDAKALRMAKLTRGYSFAFQVLGYYTWENNGIMEDAKDQFRQYLEDYAYEKIWFGLSKGDQRICYAIAKSGTGKVADVRNIIGITTNEFNPYRKRLIKCGIINGETHGYVNFILPLFEEYVLDNYDEEQEDANGGDNPD